MAIRKLTDTRCESVKAKSQRYELSDGASGLRLRVGTSGRKSWVCLIRDQAGKRRRLTLGEYPSMGLAAARKKHVDQLEMLGLGHDVASAAKRSRGMVVKKLWEEYEKGHVKTRLKPRTGAQYTDTWKNHILPHLGNRRLVALTRATVRSMHANIGAEGKTRAANLALAVLRSMLNFAIDHELITENPARGIKPFPENRRERFLNTEEIVRLQTVLDNDAPEWFADFIRLALSTGARRGNLQSMAWKDVDLVRRCWMIPPEQAKGGRLIVVSLPPVAVEILHKRKETTTSGWVFPANSESGHVINPAKMWRKVREKADLEEVRIHDLRHTLASMLRNSGAGLDIVQAQLGHASSETSRRYAHLVPATIAEAVDNATEGLGDTIAAETEEVEDAD